VHGIFFHESGLIHRDLKSPNILFSQSFKIKLCDFGLSRIASSEMTNNIGTIAWIAPEMFTNKSYTQKVDVYSFGIILWELHARRHPFDNIPTISIPISVTRGERPEIPKECPPKYRTLIKKCWNKKNNKRPNFTDITKRLYALYRNYISERMPVGNSESRGMKIKSIKRNMVNGTTKKYDVVFKQGKKLEEFDNVELSQTDSSGVGTSESLTISVSTNGIKKNS